VPIKKIIVISIAGLFFGFAFAFFWQKHQSPRNPASDLPAPKLKIWGNHQFGKMGKPIEIQIKKLNGSAEKSEQEVILEAEVFVRSHFDSEVEYQWVLPEGVELVSGYLNDSWPGIQSGQLAKTSISVIGFSKEDSPKTIILQVHGTQAGVKMGYAGAIFSDDSVDFNAASGVQSAPERGASKAPRF